MRLLGPRRRTRGPAAGSGAALGGGEINLSDCPKNGAFNGKMRGKSCGKMRDTESEPRNMEVSAGINRGAAGLLDLNLPLKLY